MDKPGPVDKARVELPPSLPQATPGVAHPGGFGPRPLATKLGEGKLSPTASFFFPAHRSVGPVAAPPHWEALF